MTLVVALRSMGRIVVLSDTMVSHPEETRRNAIPGRLKSVVVNKWLTVSYSGLSTQAIDAIRGVPQLPTCTTDSVIDHLRLKSADHGHGMDFIVCSHERTTDPRLIKISTSRVSEGADQYWIGNGDSAQALFRMDLPPMAGESGSDYYSIEERRLCRRFHDFIEKGSDSGVGGYVVNALASPLGHCYQDHFCVRFDQRTIPDPLDPSVRHALDMAGMDGYYKYSVMSSPERGVALAGIFFEQARIGYIHAPLDSDDPAKVYADTQEDFGKLLKQDPKCAHLHVS